MSSPAQQDSDDEITDAVRIALEKDPPADAGRIAVGTHGRIVTLAGVVPKDSEREAAERDAWYVATIDDVRNELVVRPGEVAGVAPEVKSGHPPPTKAPWRPRGTPAG